jgi:hypothetical protein
MTRPPARYEIRVLGLPLVSVRELGPEEPGSEGPG